jgi:hypothetical protein
VPFSSSSFALPRGVVVVVDFVLKARLFPTPYTTDTAPTRPEHDAGIVRDRVCDTPDRFPGVGGVRVGVSARASA